MKKLIISSSIWILAALFLTGSFLPEPKYPPTIMAGISEVPSEKSEGPEVSEALINPAPAEAHQPASAPAPKPVAKATNSPVVQAPAQNPAPAPAPQPKPAVPAPQPQPPAPAPISTNCEAGSFNAQFLCRINAYRNSKGLNSLVYEGALNVTAYKHSAWMSETNTMSHIGRDGSKYYERCIAENTTCDAENVAMGFTDAAKLLQAWINSPSHNVNLLGRHTVMGLGLVGKYSALVLR